MRFRSILFCALLVAPSLFARESDAVLYSDELWLREGLARQIGKFMRLTLIPDSDDKNLVAAHCETEPSWWGRLRVFHHTGDKIDWIAKLPAEYTENCGHYLLSLHWGYLRKLELPVLEVFDSTHMGNGSLWLFSVEGRELRLILHTTAVGRFWKAPNVPVSGEARFTEKHLKVEYPVLEGSEQEAVVLSGPVVVTDVTGAEVSSYLHSEMWKWNAGKRVFQRSVPVK